jgi:hypothetical protein
MVIHPGNRSYPGEVTFNYCPDLFGVHPGIDGSRTRILPADGFHGLVEEQFLACGPYAAGGFSRMGQARQYGYGEGARKAQKGLQFLKVVPGIVNDKG